MDDVLTKLFQSLSPDEPEVGLEFIRELQRRGLVPLQYKHLGYAFRGKEDDAGIYPRTIFATVAAANEVAEQYLDLQVEEVFIKGIREAPVSQEHTLRLLDLEIKALHKDRALTIIGSPSVSPTETLKNYRTAFSLVESLAQELGEPLTSLYKENKQTLGSWGQFTFLQTFSRAAHQEFLVREDLGIFLIQKLKKLIPEGDSND